MLPVMSTVKRMLRTDVRAGTATVSVAGAIDLPGGERDTLRLAPAPLLFMVAFAIKAPMVPVHTWLPDTAAVARPEVITEITRRFGSQVLVLSLDARRTEDPGCASGYEVTTHGGRRGTGIDAVAWCREASERGVGEILLNSIDADGTREGFDLEMIRDVRAVTRVPLIASGGAGEPEHFPPAVAAGADAVLAASLFHFGPDDMLARVKDALRQAGHTVR